MPDDEGGTGWMKLALATELSALNSNQERENEAIKELLLTYDALIDALEKDTTPRDSLLDQWKRTSARVLRDLSNKVAALESLKLALKVKRPNPENNAENEHV